MDKTEIKSLRYLISLIFLQVDENIQRAQKRNAAQEQKFWFKRNILPNNVENDKNTCSLKGRNEIGLEKKGLFTKIFIENWNFENLMENDYKTTESDNIDIQLLHKLCKRRSSLQLKNERNTEKYKIINEINKYGFNKKWSLQEETIDSSRLTNDDMKSENLEIRNIINGLSEKENIKNGLIQNKNKKKECREDKNINTENNCIEMTIDEIINGKVNSIIHCFSYMEQSPSR